MKKIIALFLFVLLMGGFLPLKSESAKVRWRPRYSPNVVFLKTDPNFMSLQGIPYMAPPETRGFFYHIKVQPRVNLPFGRSFRWDRYLRFYGLPEPGPGYGGKPWLYPVEEVIAQYQANIYSNMYPLLSSETRAVQSVTVAKVSSLPEDPLLPPIEIRSPSEPIRLGNLPQPKPTPPVITFVNALQKAQNLFLNGDYEGAAAFYRYAVNKQPRNGAALYGYYLTQMLQGNPELASPALEQALRSNPEWVDEPPVFASFFLNSPEFNTAVQRIQMDPPPSDASSAFLLGYSLNLLDKKEEAATALQSAIRMDAHYLPARQLQQAMQEKEIDIE